MHALSTKNIFVLILAGTFLTYRGILFDAPLEIFASSFTQRIRSKVFIERKEKGGDKVESWWLSKRPIMFVFDNLQRAAPPVIDVFFNPICIRMD